MDMLLGGTNTLTKKDIAIDMLIDSKSRITALAKFAAKAINPELRKMLNSQLDSAIKDHFELADIAIRKGWYPAFDTPEEQLTKAYNDSENLSSGR
jgi:similar to spore coat protein